MAEATAIVNNERGIQDSWSFLAFARLKGLPHPNHSKNGVTGEEFDNLVCIDDKGNRTFVAFSAKLGVLSPEQLKAQRKELQVVKLNPDADGKEGGYILCKAGNLNIGEAIDILAED